MKRFVEFSVHEYMDMYPCKEIATIEGNTIEDIEAKAKEYAAYMSEWYSGPTSFVKILTKDEIRKWIDSKWNNIILNREPDTFDINWKDIIESDFKEIYPNN